MTSVVSNRKFFVRKIYLVLVEGRARGVKISRERSSFEEGEEAGRRASLTVSGGRASQV